MEIFIALLLIMASKIHRLGFTHFNEGDKKSVFFFTENPDLHLFIDGFQTGVQGYGMLYFPINQASLHVQWVNPNGFVEQQGVYSLISEQTMILMPTKRAREVGQIL